MTSYETLLDRIISDGIAEVRITYSDPKERHKRDGAIEGFEACRGKSPPEILELWAEAERQGQQIFRNRSSASSDSKDYWKQRYKSLQLEFVLNVISVGLAQAGQPPLLGHLPTTRGAMKYAEIVGVTTAEPGSP